MNGVALTGGHVRFPNGIIYVIEKNIPLAQPELLQFVPLADGEIAGALNPLKGDFTEDLNPTLESELANLVEEIKPSSDQFPTAPVEDSTTDPSSAPPSTEAPPPPTSASPASRPTRFEKFRSRLASKGKAPHSSSGKRDEKVTSSSPPSEATLKLLQGLLGEGAVEELLVASDAGPSSPPAPTEALVAGEDFEEEFEAPVPTKTTFVSSMLDELGAVNSNGAEFSHHFLDAQLDQYFDPGKNLLDTKKC